MKPEPKGPRAGWTYGGWGLDLAARAWMRASGSWQVLGRTGSDLHEQE